MVIGTHAIPLLPQLLQEIEVSGERVCEVGFDPRGNYLKKILPQVPLDQVKSYVTIMQGCDHFCSFCIVPYVRGREQSRPSREIVEEVERLVEMGVKEVCLLGQNVNGYGKGLKEEIHFSELLHRVDEIDGLDRIRFTTSHPRDLSEELIQTYSKLSKLCGHIHLPFQSGSDNILKIMHRGYTKESYLEKIDRLKKVCPSIAVTADAIVGFPGEEERDFEETLDLIQKVRFDDLFSFKYSPRKGTRAAKFQREITLQKNQESECGVEEVLVEGRSKQSHQDVTGRTRSNKIVNFEGDLSLVGTLVSVRITKGYPHSLRGEMLGSEFASSPQYLLCRRS
jgi:tRNA-2-methylthio-N6-dimethylallyladenosine synthase